MTNYSLRVSNSNYGASFYGRTKIGNVTASANFNYSDAIDQGYNNSGTSILKTSQTITTAFKFLTHAQNMTGTISEAISIFRGSLTPSTCSQCKGT